MAPPTSSSVLQHTPLATAPPRTPSALQRILAITVPILLLQTALVICVAVLLPGLALLVLPGAAPRRAFRFLAHYVQVAWFAAAIFLLRVCLGTRIVIHAPDGATNLLENYSPSQGDVLLAANHRTRIDWMFLWGLAAALDRLGGLKIVLKDDLRKVPGFGWGTQCFGFPFMCRKDREQDLKTLCAAVKLHGGHSGSLALLIFPEGTDLSERNQAKDRAYAEEQDLLHFEQILHPRSAGFATAWMEMIRVAEECSAPAPKLLDVTVGYVDYIPGERPNEKSVFVSGRSCREVHVLVEEVAPPQDHSEAQECCRRLFEAKDERLRKFYAPCRSGGLPDLTAFGDEPGLSCLSLPGVARCLFAGSAAIVAVELTVAMLAWRWGALCTCGAFGFNCVVFAVATAAGGIDQLQFRHAACWPALRLKAKEDYLQIAN